MKRVLVIDDDAAMREVLKLRLKDWGYHPFTAEDGEAAEKILDSKNPDLVISDVVMPDLSGLDLLNRMREQGHSQPVILITAHGDVDMAVKAMKRGARDFITKPIEYDQLKALLEEIDHTEQLREESKKLERKIEKGGDFGPFIGQSKSMKEVYSIIREIASTDAPVLISGDSGTGKELVARTIHDLSKRSDRVFLAINSAAIPSELMESELFGHEKGAFTGATSSRAGCFEEADGGTLFLDEISEMSPDLQAKLLRVLEDGAVRRVGGKKEKHFDVRVLAATNRVPGKAVEEGSIRNDLYYRLNVFHIELPSLSERKGDVLLLAQYFVSSFNKKHGLSVEGIGDDARELFNDYGWPGNVRELRNVVERAVVLAKEGMIEDSDLPPYMRDPGKRSSHRVMFPAGTPLDEVEKKLILETLKTTGNNKAEAARRLGVDVKTIRNKLKIYKNPK